MSEVLNGREVTLVGGPEGVLGKKYRVSPAMRELKLPYRAHMGLPTQVLVYEIDRDKPLAYYVSEF